MKLLIVFCILVLFCTACTSKREESVSQELHVPFDTTIVFYNENGNPLRYYQYTRLLKTGKYLFKMHKGQRTIEEADPQLLKNIKLDSTALSNLLQRWMTMADKIIVSKSDRKLYLKRNGITFFEADVQLGNNPVGPKQKEGDGKTPEGLYYIDYNVNREPAYYRGFHISYPNTEDETRAKKLGVKPGGDIMIHGTGPTRANLKDWTNGCIAISNSDIDTLSKYTTNGIAIEILK